MAPDQLSQDLASLKIDRGAAPRSTLPRVVAVVVVLAALGVGGYMIVAPRLRSSLFTTEVKTGEITLVSPAQAQVQLTATGYVVALVYAKVAAKVPGRIAEIFVEEGQTIEKGARVARLEDVDFKSALASSRARAAAARARIAVARAALAEVRVQIEREAPLVEKGVSARATIDDLRSRGDSAAAGVRAAEADAAAADAETHALEIQLGSYEITTPIAGTVVDKLVKVGEGVSPGFGTPGVIEVIDMTSLVVEVDVPEARLSQVAVDGPCEIVLDAFPTRRYRGAVKEIGRRVNRSKATVPVKIRFLEPPTGKDQALPEMAARVSFLSEALDAKSLETPPKLVVPPRALAQRNARDVVFVVDDGELRMTAVQVGPAFGGGRELVTNLPPGTKVVLDPPSDLTDGQKVKEPRP
ncbi:MAG TPA: efflux RND transporter periplasmic adaptor subunit [Kofleriaceae bacterium]|nr:efflux RND transporter periplasmic adaptor subunit [Kofleriaceae bacterium]